MFSIGRFVFSLTNPSKDMLLGFSMLSTEIRGTENEYIGSVDMFSIGIFFARVDIVFNDHIDEEFLEKQN